MPRKIRELKAELEKAGFIDRSGKGSHRNFIHKNCPFNVVISGKTGSDALPYQEKAVRIALKEIRR